MMNAEKLHKIFAEIITDNNDIAYIAKIQSLSKSVNARITDQTNPDLEKQILAFQQDLFETLKNSRSHNFTLSWRKVLISLDMDLFLADKIEEHVSALFFEYKIDTQLNAGLSELHQKLVTNFQSINEIVNGFNKISIGRDDLDTGEIELSIGMPKKIFDGDFRLFNKELNKIDVQIIQISELLKNPDRNFNVRNISSNDFTVALNINIDLAEVILLIIAGVQISLLNLKTKEKALEDLKGLPSKIQADIKKWVTETITTDIDDIIDRIKIECKDTVDVRKIDNNKSSLIKCIMKYVQYIQNDVLFDIRAGLIDIDDSENDEGQETLKDKSIDVSRLERLQQSTNELQLLQKQQNQILMIEVDNDDDEKEEDMESTEKDESDDATT